MPPVLFKDVFVEIRHSLGRFLSILAIVALGVAFFAGIKASAPDMEYSADAYFDKYDVQDIQLYSTVGLDQTDVEDIRKIPGVEAVQGTFSKDFLTRKNATEQVVKVISFQKDQPLNQIRLVEGRMPEEPDECLVEADSVNNELFGNYGLGDRIRLYSGDDDPVTDTLETNTFIVVGKAYNPNYLSYEKGTSSVGSGSVDTFIYVPASAVKADYYTEIDVAVSGASEENMYADAYFALTDPVVTALEDLADASVDRRIAESRKQVAEAQADADEKLDEGQSQLDAGKQALDLAWEKIQSGALEIQANEATLAASQASLDAGWAEYYENEALLKDGLAQVNDGIDQLTALQLQIPELKQQKEDLETAIQVLPVLDKTLNALERVLAEYNDLMEQLKNADEETYEVLQARLEELEERIKELAGTDQDPEAVMRQMQDYRSQIVDQIGTVEHGKELLAQLEAGIAQAEEAVTALPDLYEKKKQLEQGQEQLQASYKTLVNAQSQLESGSEKLESAKEQLEDGQSEYESGKAEYDKNKAVFDQEKADAEARLDEAWEKVDQMKDGEWIVLDRNSHYSYRDYQACAQRMDGISSVFPVFFYLVAALVCMTTMTRMVQEDRSAIGTLKALGYSRWQIAMKYLLYAGLASIAGCVVGCCVGMVVFPWIIYSAWNTMYNLESIRFVFQPGLVLLASGSVTGIVLAATFYSIYRELMEVPSQLMRPKAGKAGKKILLERIPVFWKHVPFMHKVTLRNLFRYKKRFFMTVVGIAGCSALLVAGFGLNDSISDIVRAQFDAIYHYDATVTADADQSGLKEKIAAADNVQSVYEEEILSVVIQFDQKDVSAYLNILPDPEEFKQFMTFLPMLSTSPDASLDDAGVFISIKTAEKMGLDVGDVLHFETADGQKLEAPVAGVFDQYIDHQIYVTRSLFDTWNVKDEPNKYYLVIEDSTDQAAESAAGTRLMNLDGVKSVTFYSSLQENFLNMISSIKMVVVVLVLSAAMLAFVVLYNLANVNISERMREIATIKVLGFTPREINSYVNRESLVMAVIGGGAGLVIGIYLHNVIMALAELDSIRFGRTINPLSFVISMGLTMVFAVLVNWVMKFKLEKVEMVESLKAVE